MIKFKNDKEWQEFFGGLEPLAPTELVCINLGTGKVSEVDGDLNYYFNETVKNMFEAISAGKHDYCYSTEQIQNLLWLLNERKVNKPLKTKLHAKFACVEIWL